MSKAAKPSHPPYSVMIVKAIAALKERGGCSQQKIVGYIKANFEGIAEKPSGMVTKGIKKLQVEGKVEVGKGGPKKFALTEAGKAKPAKPAAKKEKKIVKKKPAKPKKPEAKKAKKPKKASAKKPTAKPSAKKSGTPKKKPAVKKPASKAKSPGKKAGKKPTPKKAGKKPAAKKPSKR